MDIDAGITLDHVRSLVADLALALESEGATSAAGQLRSARAGVDSGDPEELLELRSALVRTRPEWEMIHDVALLERARTILTAAKRLAIEI